MLTGRASRSSVEVIVGANWPCPLTDLATGGINQLNLSVPDSLPGDFKGAALGYT